MKFKMTKLKKINIIMIIMICLMIVKQDLIFAETKYVTEGELKKREDGEKEFIDKSGNRVKKSWIKYKDEWYYADVNGILCTKWMQDEKGTWYYFEPSDKEGKKCVMQTGIIADLDMVDLKYGAPLFYLAPTGEMKTGWQIIDDKVYYFNEIHSEERPLGTMYVDEITPDGLYVGTDGAFPWSKGAI